MSYLTICSNPECQTTAGCRCGQGTRIYTGPGLAVGGEIIRVDPRDDEIIRLQSELASIRDSTIEDCARVARAALELPGLPPEQFWEEVEADPLETCRAIVRATKLEIVAGIRALKDSTPRE